jgi:hypothetical protein
MTVPDESDPAVLDETADLANDPDPVDKPGDWPPSPGGVRVPPKQFTVPPPP